MRVGQARQRRRARNMHTTYTAKITTAPSTYLDDEDAKGSVDAAIYRDGNETAMEVTLVADHTGELAAWGTRDHWCSRTDLLDEWAVAGADPLDPDDEDYVAAAIEDARSSIIDEIVAAVRAAHDAQ